MSALPRIAVVGAGSMGVAWSIVFARSGHEVALYDPVADRFPTARLELAARVGELAKRRLISASVPAMLERVSVVPDLATAVSGATYVQECAPERIDLKQSLFAELVRQTSSDTILASSSSAIPISQVAAQLPERDRCLVVHPLNPPFLLNVVEIVPADFTRADVTTRAAALLEQAGMAPVTLKREIEGFLFNRLQGALLREAYCLVRDGVASVAEVDRAITEGLGMRWAVLGVFETVDVNTRGGVQSHAEKLGPAYARMGAERGQNDPWTPDLVARVAGERRALLPLERWEERVRWRDRRLMDIAALKRSANWHD
jgi:3-hydroxyacyl-CoA dehydrogenase